MNKLMLRSYKQKYIGLILSVGLTSLTLFSGGLLISSSVFADDNDNVVDEVNITIPISCSLSGTGMNTHNAEIANGSYNSAIGETTLKAYCNDTEGFSIYAIGYTDNTDGKNVLTNSTLGSTYDIATGTATSGSDSNWAMRLFTVSSPAPNYPIIIAGSSSDTLKEQGDPDYSSFQEVPDEYVKVAYRTSGTDIGLSAEGSTLKTTYQAYISKTQPAGTYTGQVKYTLVHPYTHAAPVACNPNGTTIGTNANTDIKCMQDFASLLSANKTILLNSMTEGAQYTLKDKRDGKEYKIAKLADGKVWMTQNLDLDLDSGTTYTNLDTDLGWNTSTNQYDAASWSPSRSTYETATNTIHAWCQGGTWNTQYGYCERNNTPESYDPGNLYWNTTTSDWIDWDTYVNSCDYSTSTPSCDESLNPLSTYTSSTGTAQYHLGNYYNWASAIASNEASIYGTYNENTGEYENLETHQSICPAGWTLPYVAYNNNTGQGEGDYVDLWSEYGWTDNDGFSNISTVWSAPLYFTPAGYFLGYFGYVGNGGYFWSSVAGSDNVARNANFGVDGDDNADPVNDYFRDYGYSVRCLLR